MKNIFWKEWIKFVFTLLIILIIWILFIFICDKYFKKSFDELKYIHYFIFMVLILKAKNLFLKKINKKEDDNQNEFLK